MDDKTASVVRMLSSLSPEQLANLISLKQSLDNAQEDRQRQNESASAAAAVDKEGKAVLQNSTKGSEAIPGSEVIPGSAIQSSRKEPTAKSSKKSVKTTKPSKTSAAIAKSETASFHFGEERDMAWEQEDKKLDDMFHAKEYPGARIRQARALLRELVHKRLMPLSTTFERLPSTRLNAVMIYFCEKFPGLYGSDKDLKKAIRRLMNNSKYYRKKNPVKKVKASKAGCEERESPQPNPKRPRKADTGNVQAAQAAQDLNKGAATSRLPGKVSRSRGPRQAGDTTPSQKLKDHLLSSPTAFMADLNAFMSRKGTESAFETAGAVAAAVEPPLVATPSLPSHLNDLPSALIMSPKRPLINPDLHSFQHPAEQGDEHEVATGKGAPTPASPLLPPNLGDFSDLWATSQHVTNSDIHLAGNGREFTTGKDNLEVGGLEWTQPSSAHFKASPAGYNQEFTTTEGDVEINECERTWLSTRPTAPKQEPVTGSAQGAQTLKEQGDHSPGHEHLEQSTPPFRSPAIAGSPPMELEGGKIPSDHGDSQFFSGLMQRNRKSSDPPMQSTVSPVENPAPPDVLRKFEAFLLHQAAFERFMTGGFGNEDAFDSGARHDSNKENLKPHDSENNGQGKDKHKEAKPCQKKEGYLGEYVIGDGRKVKPIEPRKPSGRSTAGVTKQFDDYCQVGLSKKDSHQGPQASGRTGLAGKGTNKDHMAAGGGTPHRNDKVALLLNGKVSCEVWCEEPGKMRR